MDSLVVPKFQVLDNNGNPLVGGWVWTYDSGTTTPKTTYKDRALSVSNSNPIELDSRGECFIFCSGLIKIYVTDASAVAIYPAPLDNLRPSEPGALYDTDGDTGIEVEATTDEDKIRMETAGTERLVIDYLGIKPAVGHGICDADGDTQMYVEETADDDTIRFDAAGTEIATITSSGFAMTDGSGVRINALSSNVNLSGDSDTVLSTQHAIKTYVDTVGPIPSGTLMWFYHATARTGWSLSATGSDAVLYSASAGVAGGGTRAGGTWTVSGLSNNHYHTGPSHTHAAGTLSTPFPASDWTSYYTYGTPAITSIRACRATGGDVNYIDTERDISIVGASAAGGTGNTSSPSTGPTQDGTWRPSGYVNTLQEKN